MEFDIMNNFGIAKRFADVSYYDDENLKKMMENVKGSIKLGGTVVVTGLSGSGKTTMMHEIIKKLQEEKDVVICKSLCTDKQKVSVPLIFNAFFSDLIKEKTNSNFLQAEKRERKLVELLNKNKKNLVLLIDDAHEIGRQTLLGLKRIRELDKGTEGKITFVLLGQPKLSNELRHPNMEEIGARTEIFEINHAKESMVKYCEWLLKQTTIEGIKPKDIINHDAMELLGNSLVTPLQVIKYLWLSLQKAYIAGLKPVSVEVVRDVLIPEIEGLDARLARNGYTNRYLCEHWNVRPKELKMFLKGQLVGNKAQEIHQEVLKLGIN